MMIKHFFFALFILGCHSKSDTELILTSEKKVSEVKKTLKLFDNNKPFEIVSFTNSINQHTTDTSTLKCRDWTLTKSDIEKIIKNSEPIGGTEWDLNFLVLTCTKSVSVFQSGQIFKVELNAASFFWVNNGDTSVLFGDYKKSDRKYFIETPDTN